MQANAGMVAQQPFDNFVDENQEDEPLEPWNISNLITDRFRISPPLTADVFNLLLQEHQEAGIERGMTSNGEPYSPTSPLQLQFNESDSDIGNDNGRNASHNERQIMLGLQCTLTMFSGKRRRGGTLASTQTVVIVYIFSGDEEQTKFKKT